jgi:hypothetical protein
MSEQRNPEDKSFAYPSHRMVAILDSEAAVQSALGELRKIGIDGSRVDVLQGQRGVEILDPGGERHGIVGKVLRLAQRTAEEGNALKAHRAALIAGKQIIYVTVKGKQQKSKVASALTTGGAYHLAYFGRWIVEMPQ